MRLCGGRVGADLDVVCRAERSGPAGTDTTLRLRAGFTAGVATIRLILFLESPWIATVFSFLVRGQVFGIWAILRLKMLVGTA